MRFMLIVLTMGMLMVEQSRGQATQPAGTRDEIARETATDLGQSQDAIVHEVSGRVRYAFMQQDGTVGEWTTAKAGDRLPPGTRIQTFIRSHVVLTFMDDTTIMIESGTSASIDEFRRSSDMKTVRLGIAHGAIRGASAETTLRSDLAIESPTATLSKRGTIGFRIEYEPVTGRFVISLETEGLVEALNKLTNQRRTLRPGQYVTEAMLRWIETAIFDDYIPVTDFHGMTDGDRHFGAFHANGIATIEPSGGWNTRSQVGINPTPLYIREARARRLARLRPVFIFPRQPGGPLSPRPEGNFGTGPGQ